MIIQILTYAWIIAVFVILVFLIYGILRLAYLRLTGQKIAFRKTYSYKKVWVTTGIISLIFLAITVAIYYETKSFESAISIFGFLFGCLAVGTLKSLMFENHAKSRGAQKE